MKRVVSVIVLVSSVMGAPVLAADGTLPGGTSLQVDIASPADGAIIESSAPIPVSGTAAVGASTPVKDTTVVYVVDISASTSSSSGVNCDGVGGNDTVVSCERQAVLAVNAEAAAPGSPVANSGVVTFNATGTACDVDPGGRCTGAHVARSEHRRRDRDAHAERRHQLRRRSERDEHGPRRCVGTAGEDRRVPVRRRRHGWWCHPRCAGRHDGQGVCHRWCSQLFRRQSVARCRRSGWRGRGARAHR